MLNTYMCGTLPAWYQPFIPLTVLPLGMNMHNYVQVLSTLDVTHVRKDSRLFTSWQILRLCVGEPGNKTSMKELTCITPTSYQLYQPTYIF